MGGCRYRRGGREEVDTGGEEGWEINPEHLSNVTAPSCQSTGCGKHNENHLC